MATRKTYTLHNARTGQTVRFRPASDAGWYMVDGKFADESEWHLDADMRRVECLERDLRWYQMADYILRK
jgi:hypothetical protein